MKSEVTESRGLKRRLKLEIPMEEVQKSFFKQYERIQKKARISGFRRGKAPQNLLKQNYGETVLKEVLDDLFKTFYPRALRDNRLRPAAAAHLTNIKLKENQPCALTLDLEVHPEIKSLNSLPLKIKKQDINITDSDVSEALNSLRELCAEFKECAEERAVQKGDRVSVDMDCFLNGRKVQKLTFSDGVFHTGAGDLAEGFDRHLTGLKMREEKEFRFTFDKNHPLREVAGKTCSFKVKIKKIFRKIVPELSPALAKKFGKKTVLDLKEMVRKQLHQKKEETVRRLMEDEVRDKLIQANPLLIPESLVQKRTEMLMERKQEAFKKEALPAEEGKKRLREQKGEIEKTARKTLHFTYLINRVIADFKIRLTEEDITRHLKEIGPSEDPEKIKTALKSDGQWESFIAHSTYRKALHRLIKDAEFI